MMTLDHEIFPSDHQLLKSITKIEHIPNEDNDDFTITFYFAENNYIENKYLSVKFYMLSDHDPVRTECSQIFWRDENNLFLQTVTNRQSNKKTGVTKTVTKTVEAETFFNFFRPVDPKLLNQAEDQVQLL